MKTFLIGVLFLVIGLGGLFVGSFGGKDAFEIVKFFYSIIGEVVFSVGGLVLIKLGLSEEE